MATNDERKSCVKCQKEVKGTENFLVCGLWCKKSFHNDCIGLNKNETRVVACSKERIKFHCETCEDRLGIELGGEKETHEPHKLQSGVNYYLLELIQKILKLTNEVSNDNLVINKKLDTVISSNIRLEQCILHTPKYPEKRREETTDNSIGYVESFSDRRMIESTEENDTNSDNPTVNSASMGQQTDNSSLLYVPSDFPRQLSDNQEPHVAEERSSNEFTPSEDLDVCGAFSIEKTEYEGSLEKAEDIDQEEYTTSEDLVVCSAFNIEKTEYEGGEEKAEDINQEECSSSEDLIECSTFNMEKIEHDVDQEAMREDTLEVLKHEVESASSNNEPKSTGVIGMQYNRINDDESNLSTEVSKVSRKGLMIKCTTNQNISCGRKSGGRYVEYRCNICKKVFTNLQELKEHRGTRDHQNFCDICNKTFLCSMLLKNHLRVHSGGRPYPCTVCKKTFKQKIALQRHLPVHSDERPFSCGVCSK